MHHEFLIAAGSLRLDYFSPWTAAALFAGLGGIVVFLGAKSLAGLGPVRKWTAIGVRLAVLLLAILIIGDVKWIRRNTDMELMVVRDISRSTEMVHDFPQDQGKYLQQALDNYLKSATDGSRNPEHRAADRVGEISFNERPYIDAIPGPKLELDARAIRGPGTGTDAAAAIQLGLASMDSDSLHRMLLIWDGNATGGDLNAALAAATSQHVPIDVAPLHYHVTHEVMMDKFIAPTWRQEGQPFTIEVHIVSTNSQDVQGNLSVTNNGQLMPLQDGQTTERITLHSGLNVERIQVPPQTTGTHQFHATIEGISNVSASIGGAAATDLDNKSADIFTFVKGKGQVLLVDNTDPTGQVDDARFLKAALADQKIDVVPITVQQFPNTPVQLQSYEAVILANVPRGVGGMSDEQDRMLAEYVHDTGGGLVMIGGPDTFGAGGWQGSRLEQELPVTMEVPAQRQIPKGALVLCMDPAEAPEGNYWGAQCAIKAAETLSSLDDIGVISFSWGGGGVGNGCEWDCPLGPKGDGSKVLTAIKNWPLGDLPNFDDAIRLALKGGNGSPGLIDSDARAKHIIIITDDDPEMPSQATIDLCVKNKITVSTITIFPHNPNNVAPGIVELAKATGGKNYGPIENNPNQLPQIFIKEATVVKRSIIQEDDHGIQVRLLPSASELVKGLTPGPLPPVYGMDLTGRRDNPLVEIPITAGAKSDPVLAHWQAGLGKTAVYTGDAFNRWDRDWVQSPVYEKFWSQVVRGVSRSPVSSDFEIEMTTDGEKGHVVVQAQKQDNAFNNFLSIGGGVAGGPDLANQNVHLVQTGPGIYEGDFDASAQGDYIGYFQYKGENGETGSLLAGTSVNSSPELRDLESNDTLLKQIADRTGGRLLTAFDPELPDLYTRDGIEITSSPKPVWDLLVPLLVALIVIDVAVRRIAWSMASARRMSAAAANYVRQFTGTYRKIEKPETIESLKRVRSGESAGARAGQPAQKLKSPGDALREPAAAGAERPDPSAKFDAGVGVEGDIANLVGGATDRPVPKASRDAKPKGMVPAGDHTGGLLEAKRRAQEKIRQQQENEK